MFAPAALLAAVLLADLGAPSHKSAAAIAIRDDVPAYQKAATEWFTVPYLKAGYDQYWYFTQTSEDSQHEAFVSALQEATEKFACVDIFLLAHGNRFVDWVAEVDGERRQRIRLVYNTGGGGAGQAEEWMALGVRAYVAHPGTNVAPIFYVYFLPAWVEGSPLEVAVAGANEQTREHLFGDRSRWFLDVVQGVTGWHEPPERLWQGTRATLSGDATLHASPSRRTRAAAHKLRNRSFDDTVQSGFPLSR
jgi:hypothetical protein